jgi:protein SCO1/2
VLLACYQYDPTTGRYSASVMKILRLLAVVTVASLAGFVWASLRRERGRVAAAGNA